jgi:hypothetical protein
MDVVHGNKGAEGFNEVFHLNRKGRHETLIENCKISVAKLTFFMFEFS